jgi:hypothetical protein
MLTTHILDRTRYNTYIQEKSHINRTETVGPPFPRSKCGGLKDHPGQYSVGRFRCLPAHG